VTSSLGHPDRVRLRRDLPHEMVLGEVVVGQRVVDNVLIELAPLLHAIGQTCPGCWWIRKDDTVRLRLWHPDPNDIDRISNAARQHGAQLHPGIYEPETHGFGGEAGIDVAHRLACRDSHHLAGHLARHRRHPHRNEIFLLLAIRLIRAVGLDLEEQGDVWARIAAHRPPPDTTAAATRRAVRHLIFSGPDTPIEPPAPRTRLVRRSRDRRR